MSMGLAASRCGSWRSTAGGRLTISDEGGSFPHFTRVHWVAVPQELLARRTNRRRQREPHGGG
jgi:hypothetical protein